MKIKEIQRLQKGRSGQSIKCLKHIIACTCVMEKKLNGKCMRIPVIVKCDDAREQETKYNEIKNGYYGCLEREIHVH